MVDLASMRSDFDTGLLCIAKRVGIGRIDIAGDAERVDVAALGDEEKGCPLALFGEICERAQVFASACGDRIRKGGEIVGGISAPPGDILDLEPDGCAVLAGELEIVAGSCLDAGFSKNALKRPPVIDGAVCEAFGDQAVGIGRVDRHFGGALFDELNGVGEASFGIGVMREPDPGIRHGETGKTSGIGKMSRDGGAAIRALFGDGVDEKAFVALDEAGRDQRGRELQSGSFVGWAALRLWCRIGRVAARVLDRPRRGTREWSIGYR